MSDRSRKTKRQQPAGSAEKQREQDAFSGNVSSEHAYRQLQHLYSISKLLTQFESIEHTVSRVLSVMTEAVPLRIAVLLLERDSARERIRTISWHAPDISDARLRAAKAHAQSAYGDLVGALLARRLEFDDELAANTLPRTALPPRAESEEKGMIFLPLVVNHGRIFGSLLIDGAGAPDEADLLFINAVVNQLAIALHRFGAIEARHAETEAEREAAKGAQIAAERRESEAVELRGRYEALVDNLDHAFVWEADAATLRLLYISARAQQLLGIPAEEIKERPFLAHVHADDRDIARQALRQIIEEHKDASFDARFVSRDGRRRWFHTGVHLTGSDSPTPRLQGVCIDVTAAREAAEQARRAALALKQSERHFRTMVEQVKDYAIFSIDTKGRATSWNEGVGRVLGFAEAEFLGRDVASRIFTPEDIASGVPEDELTEAARTGSANNDRPMMRKDGSRFFALGATAALIDESGALIGYTKVLRDQTPMKRLEAELLENDRRKNEFLATLAHELRNPLAPLLNGLHLMRIAGHDKPAMVDRARALMERQVEHMVRLIDDLLDLGRITSGRLELRREHIELGFVLQNALETSRPLIEAQAHTLTVTVPETAIPLDADPTRLAQVVSNLLNNSAKYTPRGGHIWLTAERQKDNVLVSVRDNGVGIPKDMLPKVFEMFTQVDRKAEQSKAGLGIGLTLVRQLVEMHGGDIEARSEGSGQGAQFIVRLPLKSPVSDSVARDQKISTDAGSHRYQILVADDNADAASSLAAILGSSGHHTHIAHDGLVAFGCAEAVRPQIALLDIGMPGLDGYEVARRIRAQPWGKSMLIAAVTGLGQPEDERRAVEAGFDHHFVKPVQISALERMFSELAGRPATEG